MSYTTTCSDNSPLLIPTITQINNGTNPQIIPGWINRCQCADDCQQPPSLWYFSAPHACGVPSYVALSAPDTLAPATHTHHTHNWYRASITLKPSPENLNTSPTKQTLSLMADNMHKCTAWCWLFTRSPAENMWARNYSKVCMIDLFFQFADLVDYLPT